MRGAFELNFGEPSQQSMGMERNTSWIPFMSPAIFDKNTILETKNLNQKF